MNTIDLKNRTAIVTGGARGIGFAIARRFLASGATVALWDMDAAALETAVASLNGGNRVCTATLDVTDETAIASAVKTLIGDAGSIDIVVNNAGITGGNAPTWELAPKIWRQVIEVNLIAPYLVCRAVVPHMVKAGYGRIVNIASIAGKEGNPNASHYSASKTGLIDQMTRAQIDYMLSKIPMNRFVAVDEIAAMVAWLSSQDCSFSTGAVFDISGGRAVY